MNNLVQSPLQGQMMDMPLNISALLTHAERYHGDTQIVSRTIEDPKQLHRYTYADAGKRSRQLAKALLKLGVKPGERVATLAWNGYRHFELYYAISGIGAVIHTINPRLFPEQIAWIANHAEDGVLFFDVTFAPLAEKLAPHCTTVKTWVALCAREHLPENIPGLLCYEDLIAAEDDHYQWPQLDERSACCLCYTSGTTGNPKGVLYSHRSMMLHTIMSGTADVFGLSARDCVLPVVPMFHVNAWAIPYSAPMLGAKLVFPGAALDGASLCELYDGEGVTFTAGVPTVWQGMLHYLQSSGKKPKTLKNMIVGGSACPPALMKTFEQDYGIKVRHAWGMTEMSPMGTLCVLKNKHLSLSKDEQFAIETSPGRPPFCVDMKIVDADNKPLPRDGKASGELMVRGPWVIERYYKADKSAAPDGWFATGDVATIDADGFIRITDRSKDVIKSGGEWISSIDLENVAAAHPAVAMAAVVGAKHPKWDERPLLVVVKKPGMDVTREELLALYPGKVAKWWIPDDVVFQPDIPLTATGKMSKLQLRQRLNDYKFPGT